MEKKFKVEGKMVKMTPEFDDLLLSMASSLDELRSIARDVLEDLPEELETDSNILYVRNDLEAICASEGYATEHWGKGTYTQVVRTDKIAEEIKNLGVSVLNALGI